MGLYQRLVCLLSSSVAEMPSSWKPLNFYVFITYDNLIESSLRIPIDFTIEYQKQIRSNNKDIILSVSDGKTWYLGWMVSGNGHLWLQKGWPEFAEHYHLKIGYLLLFNHQESSIFHVRIFNQTSCEITYFPQEIDQSMHTGDTEVLNTPAKSQNSEVDRSDNPFFSAKMPPSYHSSLGMYVPFKFCTRYLTCGKEYVDCVLHMPEVGNWGPIPCKMYKQKHGKLYGPNWKKFSNENHLVPGDVCLLELISESEKVLKVTITRANQK
uniref:B3 domain-containing protein REM9-like isoform X2 n=1 Tax=Erigeron canadensis TaxID=72917 RepID=UPI001CB92B5E|nr:B3 domain-containing protein REM9-like isoform X2 [Erigeron canadensis]